MTTGHEVLTDIYTAVSRQFRIEKTRFPLIRKMLSLEKLLHYTQSSKSELSLSEVESEDSTIWLSALTIWTSLFNSSEHSDIYQELIDACWDKNYLTILISYLSEDDMFIRYMCRKVLRSFLNSPIFQSLQKPVIESLVSCVLTNSTSQYSDNTDLLSDLLCKHVCSNVNKTCIQVLGEKWHLILKLFHNSWYSENKCSLDGCQMAFNTNQGVDIDNSKPESSVNLGNIGDTQTCTSVKKHLKKSSARVWSLLNVWVKLQRRRHDLDESGIENLDVIFPRCGLFSSTLMQNPAIFRRTLDLFHEAIGTYEKGFPVGGEVDSHVLDLCTSFLANAEFISCKMPYRKTFVGFGGSNLVRDSEDYLHNYIGDKSLLRSYVLLVLKCCVVIIKADTGDKTNSELLEQNLLHLMQFVVNKLPNQQQDNDQSFTWLVGLFQDQDDTCIECLLSMLDIYLYMSQVKSSVNSCCEILTLIDPHSIFLQWLSSLTYDHSILVDLLASPETCILLYMIRYLKCVANKWRNFVTAHNNPKKYEKDELDRGNHREQESLTNEEEESLDMISELNDCDNKIASGSSLPKENVENRKETSSALNLLLSYDDSSSSETDSSTTVAADASELSKHNHCSKHLPHFENTDRCALNISTDDRIADANLSGHEPELCDTSPTTETHIEEHSEQFSGNVSLDNTMSVLIRTRLKIEKLHSSGIFAYNPTPLIRLIINVEELYESES